jgi:hypothetical protein
MPTRNPHHLTHLNIPITHWAAAFLVVLILTAAYWANVGDVEKTIIFLALAATAAATLLNSIFTARSVQELIQDRNLGRVLRYLSTLINMPQTSHMC